MSDRVEVRFEPSGVTALTEPGTTVVEAARLAGVVVPMACGGRGTCGACAVRVLEGALAEPDDIERAALGRAPGNIRFGCRACIAADQPVTVRPLAGSTATSQPVASHSSASTGRLVAAVDLGTTTVAVTVAEADGGRVVGRASVPNRQQSWGADILTRVSAAIAGEAELLRDALVKSVAEALSLAVASAFGADFAGGRQPRLTFERVVLAGNPAMSAMFAGISVEALGQHPFKSPQYPALLTLGSIGEHEVRQTLMLPALAGFVGGDTVAGLVHVGAIDASAPELLVDLGTNAEIALAAEGSYWVASAAAGPAFEGAGIECGLPAVPGAVTSVALAENGTGVQLEVETLGGGEPVGVTGSGLVSVAALLRSLGHLDASGLLASKGPLADHFARGADGVLRLRLDDAGRITVSQKDLRALQLAKAAVVVGVRSVLEAAGRGARELSAVHVAGAFGSELSARDLAGICIIPAELETLVKPVGNTALAGALDVALDPALANRVQSLAEVTHHVDLAAMPGFNDALISALELAPC